MNEEEPESWLDIDLRTFVMIVAIDQAGSISGAARMLGYSQPAISQHLRRAEARLGVPLVVRAGRVSRLTDSGRVILRVSPGIRQGLKFASDKIHEIRALGLQRVRLVGFKDASATLVPPLVSRLRANRPDTTITYREREPMAAIESLLTAEADVALVYRYPNSEFTAPWYSADAVDIRDIMRDPLLVALPVTHPLAGQASVEMSALSQEPWIGSELEPRCLADLASAAGFEPTIPLTTHNVLASMKLVSQGFGVALTSGLEVSDVPVPPGVRLLPVDPERTRTVAVAAGVHQRESPLILETLRVLRGVASRLPRQPRH